jgi:hypothetical protein
MCNLAVAMRDHGQAAVDERVRDYVSEKKWGIKTAIHFTNAFK